MTTSSTGNDNDDDSDELRSQARRAFWKCAEEGLYQLVDSAPKVWKGRDARFYRAEKQLIETHAEPFYWGGFVTLFLFATFRISGSRFYQQFRATLSASLTRNVTRHPGGHTPPGAVSSKSKWTSHLENKTAEQQHLSHESVPLLIDMMLSIMLGVSSVLWLSKPQQLSRDFCTSPLLPGKSLIHEQVCPIFVQAQAPFASIIVAQDSNGDPDSDTLQTFATFCRNCQRRSQVIAERQAAGEPRPNVIPYPGIKSTSHPSLDRFA